MLKTLKSKMRFLLTIAIVGILLLTGLAAWQDYNSVVEARKREVQSTVESAYQIVSGYHSLMKKGELTEQQAQANAKNALRMALYGGADGKSEYIHIFSTTDGLTVMHPFKPEWEGVKKAIDIKAPNGQLLIQDMIDAVKKSPTHTAFVATMFPRPNQKEAVDKLQYVMEFGPWQWMVGSGIYMDDVAALVINKLTTTLIFSFIVVCFIFTTGVFLVKSVLSTIGGEPEAAKSIMENISQGDLRLRFSTDHDNSLLAELNKTLENLRQLIAHTQNSCEHIQIAAAELSQGNHNLSHRTEKAAANLEETAASMCELSTIVQATASNSKSLASLATNTQKVATEGNQLMSRVVISMGAIEESSFKINDIISLIDSIAFQTNILALNAAVEAARAGEQGRGFAVVASEVRNLAKKSADAAQDVKVLLSTSSSQVKEGVALAKNAGRSMAAIQESIQAVHTGITQIDSSTQEQSLGIAQVNEAVAQLDSTTQQNAALVEESAAASSALQEQAQKLAELIQRFKI